MKNKFFKDEWLVSPLINSGILSNESLEKIRVNNDNDAGKFLYDIVTSKGLVTEEQLCNLLSNIYHLPVINFESIKIDKKAVATIPKELCRKYRVLPYAIDEKYITVAISDPVNMEAENELSFVSSRFLKPVLSTKSWIEEKINQFYNTEDYVDDLSEKLDKGKKSNEFGMDNAEKVQIEIDNMATPIVKLVNSLLNDAIDKAASDIHIEQVEKKLVVRFRIDGILKKIMEIPKYAAAQLLARIKIISKLDVAETRKPQDGQAKISRNDTIVDLRVSFLPTSYGEKAVIRILDNRRSNIPFEELGITGNNLKKIQKVLSVKQGIILATGPTGSGKTSTLYAALNRIKSPTTNILTIEDPIEYTIEGINQVQVNEKSGITFATALRSFLRQDPDVILVGEIRDSETAEISIRASLTGHLVLSTLHSNSAIETITRLMDIGVDRYKVASALTAIVAQRLVRKICPRCKNELSASAIEKPLITMMKQEKLQAKYYKGSGCIHCDFSGYKGRIGIYEILLIDNDLREMISKGSTISEIEETAIAKGFKKFSSEALSMISAGITDYNEISRVISLTSAEVPNQKHEIKQIQTINPEPVLNENRDAKTNNGTSGKKILVVEDDNIMRRILISFLHKEEIYDVIEAVDGLDALKSVSNHLPDLILLDILMPKMDGYEVCRNLRNNPKYAKIPIIMLSSLEDREDLVKGFDLGIDDYITKPVDQHVLSARVAALLRRTDKNN